MREHTIVTISRQYGSGGREVGQLLDCYHIFIYADDAFREKRSKEAYEGISLKEMDKEDVSRQRYYNYYTGRTWGDPLNYDLMINTGKIDLEDAADLIIDYIEKVQSE